MTKFSFKRIWFPGMCFQTNKLLIYHHEISGYGFVRWNYQSQIFAIMVYQISWFTGLSYKILSFLHVIIFFQVILSRNRTFTIGTLHFLSTSDGLPLLLVLIVASAAFFLIVIIITVICVCYLKKSSAKEKEMHNLKAKVEKLEMSTAKACKEGKMIMVVSWSTSIWNFWKILTLYIRVISMTYNALTTNHFFTIYYQMFVV